MNELRFIFPILDGITPSLESASLKLVEEVGEVAECVGKYRGINGEKFALPNAKLNRDNLAKELYDVMQATCTVMSTIGVTQEEVFEMMLLHYDKMRSRGYLK